MGTTHGRHGATLAALGLCTASKSWCYVSSGTGFLSNYPPALTRFSGRAGDYSTREGRLVSALPGMWRLFQRANQARLHQPLICNPSRRLCSRYGRANDLISREDTVLSNKVWFPQRWAIQNSLRWIMHRNTHFELEEVLEGASVAFEAINTALYSGAEGREVVNAMCSKEVAATFLTTFEEYENNNVYMVTSNEHPSGYILHQTRLCGLVVGEPDETPGATDTDQDRPDQQDSGDTLREWEALNSDGSGRVSREAWIARYGNDSRFDQFDLDNNGHIDIDEFQQMWASDSSHWPFILVDVEYTADEVFTMIGPDGKV